MEQKLAAELSVRSAVENSAGISEFVSFPAEMSAFKRVKPVLLFPYVFL